MARILELRADQGEIITRSFRDPAPDFYVEHDPSAPVIRRDFDDLRVGDRVSTEPRHFMEIINMRVT